MYYMHKKSIYALNVPLIYLRAILSDFFLFLRLEKNVNQTRLTLSTYFAVFSASFSFLNSYFTNYVGEGFFFPFHLYALLCLLILTRFWFFLIFAFFL